MAQALLTAFNRGLISPLALARVDFKRTALSAEIQTNWMPRALGSMMLRPGTGYLGATRNSSKAITIPFEFAIDDTADLEITNGVMRVRVNDSLITRPSVTTAITNGTFNSDVSGWSDQDTGSAVSQWATGGYLSLKGTGTGAARRRQQVAVSNVGVRHALNIVVARGPVKIAVGSTAGGDNYIAETELGTGFHSLALTPSGDFYIDLFSYKEYVSLLDSIAIAPAGTMEITAPWAEADLTSLRWDQSGDIIFIACSGYRQRKIERRATDSWSIVVYQSDDGPFKVQNTGPITITPSAVKGDVTLTSSAALFRSTHVGALFKLVQTGQAASVEITGEDQFSDPIKVVGVGNSRAFGIIVTGTWTATLTLQYSISAPGDWIDATAGSFTTNVSESYNDKLDNQVLYYRIGCKAGNYTSGTATASISISSGSQTGIARITAFTDTTHVSAQVLQDFAKPTASSDWSESYWSDYRGYPSAVAFYEGRLWWAGKDRVQGSVSDNFYSFSDATEGDSGPINRSIGSGPVDKIHWLLPLQRLMIGAGGSVWAARSSSLDEPLTPTNFNLKAISGQGAAAVGAVKIDTNGSFVQRSGAKLFQTAYNSDVYDYEATDLAAHVPEVGIPSIVRVAVQRQPETRLHCIRSDGTVAILIFDPNEEIQCWVDFETDGTVEDVYVQPGAVEDKVVYTIKRTVNGATVRYHERWAMESECVGGTINKQADAFLAGTGSGSSISGLDHLEGCSVVCWADGQYKGAFTVASGAISVPYSQGYCVGLPYTAQYKSTKLAYGVTDGMTALLQKKRVHSLGIIAKSIHPTGLRYGPSFDFMDDLPLVELADDVDPEAVRDVYDAEEFTFPGDWSTDSRLCLEAGPMKPVTLLACLIGLETNARG